MSGCDDFCQKAGRAGFSSSRRTSDLESSERVVSELLLDSDEPSEGRWLPASEGETGTAAGRVSPGDAGCFLMLCWMLPRERMRPREARREWERRDLTDGALDRGWESTLSGVGVDVVGVEGARAWEGAEEGEAGRRGRVPAATSGGTAAGVAWERLVAQRGSATGRGAAAVGGGGVAVSGRGAVECL